MGHRWRVSTGLLVACGAIGGWVAPAGAESGSEAQVAAEVPQTPDAIRDYWTNERMREARPIDRVVNGVGAILGGADSSAAPKRGGGAASPVRHRKRFPKRTHGKVYVTINGSNYVCSGTSVRAPNESLVLTAGHCAFECAGLLSCGGVRATNFNFVPAFKNGTKPFGEWPARGGGVRATPQYETDENLAFDVGAAVIAQRNGRTLQDVIGARGIAFNESANQLYKVFGYPALAPFNGQSPYICRSNSSGRDNSVSGPATIRISCDMTGGASGGGWVIDGGRVASVTSYGYGSQPGKLYGPYFGSAIASFYNSVKND